MVLSFWSPWSCCWFLALWSGSWSQVLGPLGLVLGFELYGLDLDLQFLVSLILFLVLSSVVLILISSSWSPWPCSWFWALWSWSWSPVLGLLDLVLGFELCGLDLDLQFLVPLALFLVLSSMVWILISISSSWSPWSCSWFWALWSWSWSPVLGPLRLVLGFELYGLDLDLGLEFLVPLILLLVLSSVVLILVCCRVLRSWSWLWIFDLVYITAIYGVKLLSAVAGISLLSYSCHFWAKSPVWKPNLYETNFSGTHTAVLQNISSSQIID